MQQYDPKGYEQLRKEAGPSPREQIEKAAKEAEQAIKNGEIDFPFNQAPLKQAEPNSFQATPQREATPQGEAIQQDFQAVQYGAPVEPIDIEEKKEKKEVEQKDPFADVVPENPWNTEENLKEIYTFREHKKRLKIEKDADLLPHIREYFKSEKATIAHLTPETLKGFNEYLENIQV